MPKADSAAVAAVVVFVVIVYRKISVVEMMLKLIVTVAYLPTTRKNYDLNVHNYSSSHPLMMMISATTKIVTR